MGFSSGSTTASTNAGLGEASAAWLSRDGKWLSPAPPGERTYDASRRGYVVNLTKEHHQGAPTYSGSEVPAWEDAAYRAESMLSPVPLRGGRGQLRPCRTFHDYLAAEYGVRQVRTISISVKAR